MSHESVAIDQAAKPTAFVRLKLEGSVSL